MRTNRRVLSLSLLTLSTLALAADVRVILSGEVAPGVYGRVDFGSSPPPPIVYAEPITIRAPAVAVQPVYLHVPPGHAKHWSKHCAKYNACGQPVYFVKSAEYDKKPKKAKKEKTG